MSEKSVVFFIPDIIGGVSSVVNNYIKFLDSDIDKPKIEVVKTRNRSRNCTHLNFEIPKCSNHIFEYCSLENRHYVHKRLIQQHIKDKNIIVSTDYLELDALHEFAINTTVHFLILGDFNFYYDLAIRHESVINTFIAISDDIYNNLIKRIPHRRSDIYRLNYSVPKASSLNNPALKLKAIFVARLNKEKGTDQLIEIDKQLRYSGINLLWTIVGDGPEMITLVKYSEAAGNFDFKGFITYDQLLSIYSQHHFYILPSVSEGMPISMVEAMKYGLIPLVNDIDGGIRDVITNEVNGYLINNNAVGYAEKLRRLIHDKNIYNTIRQSAIESANQSFDPLKNSKIFFDHISKVKSHTKPLHPSNFVSSNRLDRVWLPNALVKALRKAIKKI